MVLLAVVATAIATMIVVVATAATDVAMTAVLPAITTTMTVEATVAIAAIEMMATAVVDAVALIDTKAAAVAMMATMAVVMAATALLAAITARLVSVAAAVAMAATIARTVATAVALLAMLLVTQPLVTTVTALATILVRNAVTALARSRRRRVLASISDLLMYLQLSLGEWLRETGAKKKWFQSGRCLLGCATTRHRTPTDLLVSIVASGLWATITLFLYHNHIALFGWASLSLRYLVRASAEFSVSPRAYLMSVNSIVSRQRTLHRAWL